MTATTIQTLTTYELVDQVGADALNAFMQDHGDELALAYTDDEPFSEVIHAPTEFGYRRSDVLVAYNDRGRMVGLLQPLFSQISPLILDLVPEALRVKAHEQGILLTNPCFGPMVVERASRGQGVARELLRACIGGYFPHAIREMRSTQSAIANLVDVKRYGNDAEARVRSSLVSPLFTLESEHLRLLASMMKVVNEYAHLYTVSPADMGDVERAVAQALSGVFLSGSLAKVQQDTNLKLITQLRTATEVPGVSRIERTFVTTRNSEDLFAAGCNALKNRATTSAVLGEGDKTQGFQITVANVNGANRDAIVKDFIELAEQREIPSSRSAENVYRAVVETRY